MSILQQAPIKGPDNPYDPNNYDDYSADEYGGYGSGGGGGTGGPGFGVGAGGNGPMRGGPVGRGPPGRFGAGPPRGAPIGGCVLEIIRRFSYDLIGIPFFHAIYFSFLNFQTASTRSISRRIRWRM